MLMEGFKSLISSDSSIGSRHVSLHIAKISVLASRSSFVILYCVLFFCGSLELRGNGDWSGDSPA